MKFFDGTFEQFKESKAAEDTNYKYWCTQGGMSFGLFRYDFIKGTWVNAGINTSGNSYAYINLKTYHTSSVYYEWVNSGNGDYSKLNEAFKDAMMSHMRKHLKYFIANAHFFEQFGDFLFVCGIYFHREISFDGSCWL